MKALQLQTQVGTHALARADVPRPVPGSNQVLVRVHAVGVTPSELDWYPTTHTRAGERREQAIPGHEFSGVIAELGPEVRDLAVGDEIYGMNDWFVDGAAAEYCLTEPAWIAPKPGTFTHEQAAAVPISALTAWQALFDRAGLQPGETIMIIGGSGSVGSFAIQLAHAHGAIVSTTGSARSLELMRGLGADIALEYRSSPFEGKAGCFDVILDTVGGETLERAWELLKQSGRMVTVATASEAMADQRAKDAFFIVEPKRDQLVEITKKLEGGALEVLVNAVVPFEQAAKAYGGLVDGKRGAGKVVISVAAG